MAGVPVSTGVLGARRSTVAAQQSFYDADHGKCVCLRNYRPNAYFSRVLLEFRAGVLREHHHRHGWRNFQQSACGLQAIYSGHLEINDHHVGPDAPEHLYRRDSVRGLPDYFPLWICL
jgi:hypothetical protein